MMSLVSPSSPNTAANTSPVSSPKGRYHHYSHSDEDSSVVSRSSSSASSSSEFIQLSSPSSSFRGTPKKMKNLAFHEATATPNRHGLPETKQLPLLLPSKAQTALHRWYGNADFSDRIGRTVSFLLVARLALSFLLATILDEE